MKLWRIFTKFQWEIKLVELLKIMKGCIMHHVHPWAGMEQCGDWGGYINKLHGYDIDSILSKYVRIS